MPNSRKKQTALSLRFMLTAYIGSFQSSSSLAPSRAVSVMDAYSKYVWFFQGLLREHIFFQARIEANVFERQDRLRAFGGRAHLYPFCDPDAGDFFEGAGFQNPLFLALFVVHL